jgi:hypothetical protein
MRKTAGQQFRDRMDAELTRVAAILGSELAWSPGEVELLETVERDADRRAALERAHAACEDISAPRALKVAQEIRLIEAQTARLVRQLQKELSRLLSQRPTDEEPQAPPSMASRKASRAAKVRWNREHLRQTAIQERYRSPGETG